MLDTVALLQQEIRGHHVLRIIVPYLLQRTTDASLAWFAAGDSKNRANVVGDRKTAKPNEVAAQIQSLLSEYNELP